VESWVEEGLIDAERVYTSAAGVYSKTVAEHAFALMLAGARRLHEAARATSWEGRFRPPLRRLDHRDIWAPAGYREGPDPHARTFGYAHPGRDAQRARGARGDRELLCDQTGSSGRRATSSSSPLPLQRATEKMIGAPALSAMQDHAWDRERGAGFSDRHDALIEALAEGSNRRGSPGRHRPRAAPGRAPVVDRAASPDHTAHREPPDALARALAGRIEENVARFEAGEELIGVIDVEAATDGARDTRRRR
jgi:D-3-phosphoglycerate dehydrogenase